MRFGFGKELLQGTDRLEEALFVFGFLGRDHHTPGDVEEVELQALERMVARHLLELPGLGLFCRGDFKPAVGQEVAGPGAATAVVVGTESTPSHPRLAGEADDRGCLRVVPGLPPVDFRSAEWMPISSVDGAEMRSAEPTGAYPGGFEDLPDLPSRKGPLLTFPLFDGDGSYSDALGELLPAQLDRVPELDKAVGELVGAGHMRFNTRVWNACTQTSWLDPPAPARNRVMVKNVPMVLIPRRLSACDARRHWVRLLAETANSGSPLEITRRGQRSVFLVPANEFERRLLGRDPWPNLRGKLRSLGFQPNGLVPGVRHRWTHCSSAWIRDHFASFLADVDQSLVPMLVTRRGKSGLLLLSKPTFEGHWNPSVPLPQSASEVVG
jgi:PHD/YefM family antitoxin component YafN of YafNO toxin-antitoxin module